MGFLDRGVPLWGEHRLLVTTSSFHCGTNKDGSIKGPTRVSSMMTVLFFVSIITLQEQLLYQFFRFIKSYHPLLEDTHHCEILARNLGVRAICALAVTLCGWRHSHIFSELTQHFFQRKSMDASGFERRLFTYHPGAHQCSILFCSYQLKNTVDFLFYQEEYLNLVHHIVSVIMAWICMHPGSTHFYVVASSATELPASLSSVYVNFDDGFMRGHVPGLGNAFPKIKQFFAISSGLAFLAFRAVFWFYVFGQYFKDLKRALKSNRPSCQKWKKWIPLYIICAGLLFWIQLILLRTVFMYIPRVLGKLLAR